MTKRRRTRQYNDQKKKDKTMQCPKEEEQDNTMTRRRRTRQYNDQKKKDKTIE
jgi:ribosomal protein L37E